MTMRAVVRLASVGVAGMMLAVTAAQASGINGINQQMPSRLSVNVTVPRQTQGATFGEKVSSGLQSGASALSQGASLTVLIECGQDACTVTLPDGDGYRADLRRTRVEVLKSNKTGDPGQRRMQATMTGGAVPGAGIVSAAITSVGALAGAGSGAAAASYARAAQAHEAVPLRSTGTAAEGRIKVLEPLADGDYVMTLIVAEANAAPGTALNARKQAGAAQRVRIVLGFRVADGVVHTLHDSPRNMISVVR